MTCSNCGASFRKTRCLPYCGYEKRSDRRGTPAGDQRIYARSLRCCIFRSAWRTGKAHSSLALLVIVVVAAVAFLAAFFIQLRRRLRCAGRMPRSKAEQLCRRRYDALLPRLRKRPCLQRVYEKYRRSARCLNARKRGESCAETAESWQASRKGDLLITSQAPVLPARECSGLSKPVSFMGSRMPSQSGAPGRMRFDRNRSF